MAIWNAREVAGALGFSKNTVYKLPIRQKVEGTRDVVFSSQSVKTYANGKPQKADATHFDKTDKSFADPFSKVSDGYVISED